MPDASRTEDTGGRFCLRCAAALPAEREAALCVLCSSGLGPPLASSSNGASIPPESAEAADPASDSGLRCPHCRSRLNYRDVGRQLCPVCGEGTGIDSLFRQDPVAAGSGEAAGLRFSAPLDTQSRDEPPWDMQYPIW
ncbi:hypothetical protein IT575_07395 [bacterium]|nr:hypothetical protein [bacterium]